MLFHFQAWLCNILYNTGVMLYISIYPVIFMSYNMNYLVISDNMFISFHLKKQHPGQVRITQAIPV